MPGRRRVGALSSWAKKKGVVTAVIAGGADQPDVERLGSNTAREGFTLIELLAVLVLIAILAVSASIYYGNMLNESKKHGAMTLITTAQSQLSFEFARLAVAGLALGSNVQPVCESVIITSPDVNASITCVGNLADYVAITATIDSVNATGAWVSPLNMGP